MNRIARATIPFALVLAAACARPTSPPAAPPPPFEERVVTYTAADVVPIDSVDVRPEVLNRAELSRAMMRHSADVDLSTTHTALVRFVVDLDGLAKEASIARPSGTPAIDRAALRIVEGVRFEPARKGGKAVVTRITMPIQFGPNRRNP